MRIQTKYLEIERLLAEMGGEKNTSRNWWGVEGVQGGTFEGGSMKKPH